MSILPALGSRQYPAPALGTASQQAGSKTGGAGDSALMSRGALDAVSLSQNGIDLSAQGMLERTDSLGNATVDVAQQFMNSFTQQLLGKQASGATISYDSVSLSAQSGFAAQVQHSGGAGGGDAAALSLSESSHFIGKGTITTADGQSFSFEIEVQYSSTLDAAASDNTTNSANSASNGAANKVGNGAADGGASAALPTVELPHVPFPGNLSDLFKLLGQELQGDVSGTQQNGAAAPSGTLKLRLLNLINGGTAQAPANAATPAQNSAQTRAKALADAYGAPPPASAAPVPLAPDSLAPAPLAA
ncbi:hypothetical protein AAKU55_000052 [Oxalobacteraceae bacterium GrIS 1.11]